MSFFKTAAAAAIGFGVVYGLVMLVQYLTTDKPASSTPANAAAPNK